MRRVLSLILAGVFCAAGCAADAHKPPATTGTLATTPAAASAPLDAIGRLEFNRRAAELALPFFWINDTNKNGALDPAEFAVLWGVSKQTRGSFVENHGGTDQHFTPMFQLAYAAMQKPTPVAPTELPAEKACSLSWPRDGRPSC